MLESQRLKNIQYDIKLRRDLETSKEIISKLEGSIRDGYKGTYWGFFINSDVGAYLTSQGIKWKTYSDGIEFEESEVWIE